MRRYGWQTKKHERCRGGGLAIDPYESAASGAGNMFALKKSKENILINAIDWDALIIVMCHKTVGLFYHEGYY